MTLKVLLSPPGIPLCNTGDEGAAELSLLSSELLDDEAIVECSSSLSDNNVRLRTMVVLLVRTFFPKDDAESESDNTSAMPWLELLVYVLWLVRWSFLHKVFWLDESSGSE